MTNFPVPQQTYAFISPNKDDVVAANAQIESNSGIPTGDTLRWDTPTFALDPYNFWFITMPPENGWNGHSQAEMIAGVINVTIEPYNVAWIKPLI